MERGAGREWRAPEEKEREGKGAVWEMQQERWRKRGNYTWTWVAPAPHLHIPTTHVPCTSPGSVHWLAAGKSKAGEEPREKGRGLIIIRLLWTILPCCWNKALDFPIITTYLFFFFKIKFPLSLWLSLISFRQGKPLTSSLLPRSPAFPYTQSLLPMCSRLLSPSLFSWRKWQSLLRECAGWACFVIQTFYSGYHYVLKRKICIG